jgi:hypothetical protein
MSKRFLFSAIGLVGVIAVIGLALAPAIQAQQDSAYMAPRTPWGDPDFQGAWENRSPTPLERDPQYGTREFMTEEEAASRAQTRGGLPDGEEGVIAEDLAQADVQRTDRSNNIDATRPGQKISGAEYNSFWNAPVSSRLTSLRTSQIIDPPNGRIPAYTRVALENWEAREAARAHRGEADDWLDRNVMERCLLRTGLAMGEMNVPKDIYQTPGQIVFDLQYGVVRTIPLDGRPHLGSSITQWFGDSRGRWEGDTLVVETTNFNNLQRGGDVMPSHGGLYGNNHAHHHPGTGEELTMVERFTRTGPDTIDYTYTVTDPSVYVAPFTAVNTWHVDPNNPDVFEYTCHEHNYGMVGLLKGGRTDEQISMDEAAREVNDRKPQFAAEWEQTRAWEAQNR